MSEASSVVVHPASPARRGASRAATWWGKAWVRGLEEAAYDERDLKRGRTLSRAGNVGEVMLEPGRMVASVGDDAGLWTAVLTLPTLDAAGRDALVEVITAESGRIASLLDGDLPHTLVEHAEESGVELLPFGSEWEATCTCDAWLDPCPHALALLYRVTWLVDTEPLVLLHLRGLPRAEILARLHHRSVESIESDEADPSIEVAVDAALRARRILETLSEPGARIEHLF